MGFFSNEAPKLLYILIMSDSFAESQKDGQNNNSTGELLVHMLVHMTNGGYDTGVENNSSGRTTTNANDMLSKEIPDPDKMKIVTGGTDDVANKVRGQ